MKACKRFERCITMKHLLFITSATILIFLVGCHLGGIGQLYNGGEFFSVYT